MDFHDTGLPDRKILHSALCVGMERFSGTPEEEARYMQGPVAMARMILRHGGDCHQLAAAACLAGPSLFSSRPDPRLDPRLLPLRREILSAEEGENMPCLSPAARIFLQASAIMMLETIAGEKECGAAVLRDTFNEAVILYSAARGRRDIYDMDGRFEAVMREAGIYEGDSASST